MSAAAIFVMVPAAATAEVGAAISLFNDYRFRGYTLSNGRPVAILDIGYDAPNGIYGAISGSLVASDGDGIQPLRLAINGGYATPLFRGVAADIGIVHARYSSYSGLASGRSYSEAYVGVSDKTVGARLSLSPDYLGTSRWTLHAAINARKAISSTLTIDGELGSLFPLGGGYSRGRWDARAGLSQRIGRISLHAAVTARAKSANAYIARYHHPTAFIIGISSPL
ncbi:MAG: TorF family putative porin [Sphingomicrobium sp.]